MEIAVFRSYDNGYFTFAFQNEIEIVFEEIDPRVLRKYDLKNDLSFKNKSFSISFSDTIDEEDDDLIIYRIENLELINLN